MSDAGLATSSEEEEFAVVVNGTGLDCGYGRIIGCCCCLKEVGTEVRGSNWLAQEPGSCGDFRVECVLEVSRGMVDNILKDLLELLCPGCVLLVDRDTLG